MLNSLTLFKAHVFQDGGYRMWGIAELRWVVTLAAGLEDESQGMTVGKKLKLPPATWIREMIRHFQYDGQVIGTLSIA